MSGFIKKITGAFGKKAESMTDLQEFGLAIYGIDTLSDRQQKTTEALIAYAKGDWSKFMETSNEMVVKAAMAWYTAGSKASSDRVLRGWYGIWEEWCKLKRDFNGDCNDYDFLTTAEGYARLAFRSLSKSFFTEHVMPQKPIVIQTLGGKKGPDYIGAGVGASPPED